jgi:DNA-binding NarL/FixJ family response regulator
MARDHGDAQLVLVADDDQAFCSLLVECLDGDGYAVIAASRGEAALELARRERPDGFVLDVNLPGLYGYELCSRLREERGDSVPIVLISGTCTEPYDRVAGLLLGADDYLVKPFEPNELLVRLRRLLRRVPREPQVKRLTPREVEVLGLLAQGYGQREIASTLVISSKTVATHIEHILEKLGVHSRAQAVASAHRHGLIEQRH